MNLADYYYKKDNSVFFSKQQASDFAKNIANDFNPIHDVDAKKFCVPGDLLFAVILENYGLYQEMCFNFSGMVGDNVLLKLPAMQTNKITEIKDENDKLYLNFSADGKLTRDNQLISTFIQEYVKFSGKAFPHLLVPLMQQHQVMINPERPLVIYESMSIKLDNIDIQNFQLSLFKTGIDVEGKRGKACFQFDLIRDGNKIGCGKKNMILSGLRPYDNDKMNTLIEQYNLKNNRLTD